MTRKIYTRRQGQTTIKSGQYLIIDALGNNLEVVNRISSGAMVTIFKMNNDGGFKRYYF